MDTYAIYLETPICNLILMKADVDGIFKFQAYIEPEVAKSEFDDLVVNEEDSLTIIAKKILRRDKVRPRILKVSDPNDLQKYYEGKDLDDLDIDNGWFKLHGLPVSSKILEELPIVFDLSITNVETKDILLNNIL